MMDFLVSNFEIFAEGYMRCLIVIYIIGMAVLCAFWLKPFTKNHKAAYFTAITYLIFRFIYYLIPIDNDFLRILALGIIFISFLTVWLIDKKRNYYNSQCQSAQEIIVNRNQIIYKSEY